MVHGQPGRRLQAGSHGVQSLAAQHVSKTAEAGTLYNVSYVIQTNGGQLCITSDRLCITTRGLGPLNQ